MLETAAKIPPNALFDLVRQFNQDACPDKLSLVIGAYRDADLRPYVFDAVRKVRAARSPRNNSLHKGSLAYRPKSRC